MSQQKVETLCAMMEQDFTFSYRDYLSDDSGDVPDDRTNKIGIKVTSDDRAKIVDWCYAVIDVFDLNREHVARAMSIVDRFMSSPHWEPSSDILPCFSHQDILYDRSMYQLLVVSALYIAIKIDERELFFSAEGLAAMSRGIYSAANIEAMESTILERLSWRVCAPTVVQVGSVIIELMMAQVDVSIGTVVDDSRWESILDELQFQSESAVRDYQLATQCPSSSIAYMAIMNAIGFDREMVDIERCLLTKALVDIFVQVNNYLTIQKSQLGTDERNFERSTT